jgi:hypothetical protein
MTLESHRCSVDGCPNLAAFEVQLYGFDLAEGAVTFTLDDTCPFICVEHAIDNERHTIDDRKPWLTVRYPHTNRDRHPGITVYMQLEPAYVA